VTALLSVEGIGIAFGGVQVLQDVSFSMPEGGRVALIGPNGAGKTTLFNVLSGVHAPNAGRLLLRGQDFTRLPANRRIGLGLSRSFQNIRLMPHLSVVENVMLGQHSRASGSALFSLVARGRWRREAEARLASFGLGTYPGEAVSDLPYGVRKKIEVVRALMSEPSLMLLDEPAAGLNPRETADLNDFLLRIAADGVAMLVVEHDMSLVRGLCTHAVVLDFGRKIYDGPTDSVQNDPAVLEAYLGRRHAQAVTHAA
jgi:branched-chain amino acid transport system ATP-binding protein